MVCGVWCVVCGVCCVVCCVLCVVCCVLCVVCCVLCVVPLFHSSLTACDVTTKLAPDAPSPRRNKTKLGEDCSRDSTTPFRPSHLHAWRRAP